MDQQYKSDEYQRRLAHAESAVQHQKSVLKQYDIILGCYERYDENTKELRDAERNGEDDRSIEIYRDRVRDSEQILKDSEQALEALGSVEGESSSCEIM